MTSESLQDNDFQFIRNLVKERSAIVLEENKAYLVESRLTSLLKKLNMSSLKELIQRARTEPNSSLTQSIVDAMTTNETSFFRDLHPFEALKKEIVAKLVSRCQKEKCLNIWCGAASTGQEPYTIAMVIKEFFPQLHDWRINILATDLSEDVLTRARTGDYSQLEVNRGLPAPLLVKYFQKSGLTWQIKPEIRNMVEFRKLNLIESWPILPKMDLIFLRNVLIYFDPQVKSKILEKTHHVLHPDGYLFLGATETASTLNVAIPLFERIQVAGSFCFSPIRSKGA